MSLTFNGTSGLTFPDGTTQNTQALPGMRNRIINGDMRIDQRNAGGSITPTTGAVYNVDRWHTACAQVGKVSVQQNQGSVTPPSVFTHYVGINSLSAYSVVSTDFFTIQQTIEANSMVDLAWGTANAQPITLTFWVRSSLTGTFGGYVGNGITPPTTYPFSYSISAANTWEFKTITIAGPTSGTWTRSGNGIGMVVGLSLGMGSSNSGPANAWQNGGTYYAPTGTVSVVGTSGATFYVTGVQVEKGTTATPFEYRPYGAELALCQRYFLSMNGIGVAGYNVIGNTIMSTYVFPATMRTIPTMAWISYGTQLNATTPAFYSTNSTATAPGINAVAAGAAYIHGATATASAEL